MVASSVSGSGYALLPCLPFVGIEDFNAHPYYPDVFAEDFEVWADYVAHRSCVDMDERSAFVGYTLCPRPAFQKQEKGTWAIGILEIPMA